jgi:GAF domain-containing protein
MALDLATANELATLSGVVLSATDLSAALHEVSLVAQRVVPGCDGASVTMRERGTARSTAASNAWAKEVDTLQVVVQEGPCLDCMREGSVQRVPDLAKDGRFPTYGPQAAARGAGATLSVPLSADGQTVGALNVYSHEVDRFGQDALAITMLVAAHGQLAVLAAQAYLASQALAGQLQEALTSRVVIEQAKGVLMGRLRCDAETAYRHLVEQSQRSNTRLHVVAAQVIAEGTG